MIASLRDAEIELNDLKLKLSSVTRKLALSTGSSGTGNVLSNSTPPPYIPTDIYDTSSSLAGLPTGLTIANRGQHYYNSYFKRWWNWDGANWHYLDSGIGAGGQVSTSGATAPEGGLWQACDGSTVSCALDNATIGNKVASPAQATGGNNPIIQGGAGDTTQHAATAPTLASSSVTSGNDSGSGTVVLSGVGTTVAAHTHTHDITLPAINSPTDAVGTGLRISMVWWMRR